MTDFLGSDTESVEQCAYTTQINVDKLKDEYLPHSRLVLSMIKVKTKKLYIVYTNNYNVPYRLSP